MAGFLTISFQSNPIQTHGTQVRQVCIAAAAKQQQHQETRQKACWISLRSSCCLNALSNQKSRKVFLFTFSSSEFWTIQSNPIAGSAKEATLAFICGELLLLLFVLLPALVFQPERKELTIALLCAMLLMLVVFVFYFLGFVMQDPKLSTIGLH